LTLRILHEESKQTDTFEHKKFQIPLKDFVSTHTAFHVTDKDLNKLSTDKVTMFHKKVLRTSGLMAKK
jgi:hypothetical protein